MKVMFIIILFVYVEVNFAEDPTQMGDTDENNNLGI